MTSKTKKKQKKVCYLRTFSFVFFSKPTTPPFLFVLPEPLASRVGRQSHALKVKPLAATLGVVAPHHLPKRHTLTNAVGRLVRIDRHVKSNVKSTSNPAKT
jgi:hypothetical protein